MSLTVGLTPNVSTFTYGDADIALTLSGGGSAWLWESNQGVFGTAGTFTSGDIQYGKFSSTPTFRPNNASGVTQIIGRKVSHAIATGFATYEFTAEGSFGGWKKYTGSNSWDGGFTNGTNLSGDDIFLQCSTAENNTEKAMGFLANSTYRDPNTVHATNAFVLCWHMYSNGIAIPRKLGVAQAAPVPYVAGDDFRIHINNTTLVATYYLNGKVVATTLFTGFVNALYATLSFKTVNGTLITPSLFTDSSTNMGTANLTSFGVFPVQPNFSYDVSFDNKTLISFAEDGSATYRVKSPPKRSINLVFNNRPYSDYVKIYDFWQAHQKHIQFYYVDYVYGLTYKVVHDSGLKVQTVGPDQHTMTIVLRET